VNFGRDPNNQQIFTLTNLEGDIYCASHGAPAPSHFCYIYPLLLPLTHRTLNKAQLLPTHIVTVRYMSEHAHTDAHYARVGMYNAALCDRIKPRPLYLPDRQLPPQAQDPQAHAHFKNVM